jgi:dihydropteroate synthase
VRAGGDPAVRAAQPRRAAHSVILRLRDHELRLREGVPLVMGIVNLGEDSVADPLRLGSVAERLAHARAQRAAGADIVDLGVQSGRTDTAVISEREELAHLRPVIAELAAEGVPVSVETWRPEVAAGAIEAGAALINDVSGLADPRLADLAAAAGAGLVLMHTRARPKEERFPGYDDPVADVVQLLTERRATAIAHGVPADRLVADPGLDFAKTPSESIEVLRRLPELHALGMPVLLAVSRKYFIGMLADAGPTERLAGTLAAVGFGVSAGAQIVRVHDVAAVRQYLDVRLALQHEGGPLFKGDPGDAALKWLPAPGGAG